MVKKTAGSRARFVAKTMTHARHPSRTQRVAVATQPDGPKALRAKRGVQRAIRAALNAGRCGGCATGGRVGWRAGKVWKSPKKTDFVRFPPISADFGRQGPARVLASARRL